MTNAKPHPMQKITHFWSWFQKNEAEIVNALLLGIRTDAVCFELQQKLRLVSEGIGFIITIPKENPKEFRIIFSCQGQPELFDTLLGLEKLAPPLKYTSAQVLIPPLEEERLQ